MHTTLKVQQSIGGNCGKSVLLYDEGRDFTGELPADKAPAIMKRLGARLKVFFNADIKEGALEGYMIVNPSLVELLDEVPDPGW